MMTPRLAIRNALAAERRADSLSGRCCPGQDNGTGIWRAADQRPGYFGVPVTGDHAAIQYRTVVLAAGGILRPDQVSITAPVNNLPRAPAALLARREEELARLGPVRGRAHSRHAGSAQAGRCGEIRAGAAGQLGTSAFSSARRIGRLLLPSGAGYRFTRHPQPGARGFPGRAVTAGQRQPGAFPGPTRPKARIPQIKGRAERQISAIWTLIDIEHVRKQMGGDARLVLVTGLRGATVRSAKLGMRTGWNAAAACHRAGLAGTFGVMEN
jgi:hypothetical protein